LNAEGFIETDVTPEFEIVSHQANPASLPGTPMLEQFCAVLEEFKRSAHFPNAPQQVVILAYHGTLEKTVPLILGSNVMIGRRAMYGPGAYFTTDINVADHFSLEQQRIAGGRIYVVVSALIMDINKYHFPGENASLPAGARDRPLSYIVNTDVSAQIPLFSYVLRRVNGRKNARGTEVVFRGLHSGTTRGTISGNSSTNTRNAGGTRKRKRKKQNVLFMSLDGKVGIQKV
jgi:hypothetical protein